MTAWFVSSMLVVSISLNAAAADFLVVFGVEFLRLCFFFGLSGKKKVITS